MPRACPGIPTPSTPLALLGKDDTAVMCHDQTPAPRPAPAPGLPPRQGTVLAILWDAPHPLSAAQIATRLPTPGVGHALGQLRAAGLITTTRHGRAHRYQAALGRDAYLAALITAALDQAGDSAAVLRAALHAPPTR